MLIKFNDRSGVSEDNFSSILRASKLSGVMKKLERLLVTSEHNLLSARANLLIGHRVTNQDSWRANVHVVSSVRYFIFATSNVMLSPPS